ncbi:hypothetical protein HZH68_006621 [Vespula germanica]|uniref:C2H2-type domain-containing protein n=1 Tax=Vespula germanica TaxID=30212 RepID=A0A834KDA0_VESGE|nr:hypothetical protein HZH68_006621 [Vespula germanica]
MYPPMVSNDSIMSLEKFGASSSLQNRLPIVRAVTFLRKDATSEIIELNKFPEKGASIAKYVEIAESEGRLYSLDRHISASSWLKIVTLATDCHTNNILLIPSGKGVIMKTIRDIAPGELLFLWFSENLLLILNIPFLNPRNIQGQDRYICHICHTVFEYPNPLKLHVSLDCDRLDLNHLWNLLSRKITSLSNLCSPTPFRFQLTASRNMISPILIEPPNSHRSLNPSPTSSNQFSPSSSNQPSPGQISPHLLSSIYSIRHNLLNRQSAFKPYSYINGPGVLSGLCPSTANDDTQPVLERQPTTTHAAEIETIASNLGKSKEGHLCIYCGKVYSRKYGLKIHIRTHTGYKPLLCKYCHRPFGDPSNLNKHMRLHADAESPYKCEICGKILVRRRDLERHIKSKHQNNIDTISETSDDELDV